VAAVAAKLGLKARLVQENWVNWPDAVNDRVGNILLSRIMGADVRLVDEGFGIKTSWEQALDDVRSEGGKPYAIPAGASDHRRGGLRQLGSDTRAQVEKIARNTAGLIDLIRTGQIARGSTVLYAHLGGQPALNAYSALFR
jgi:1-aminocyclopropane-1-carboxylate deaminase